MSATNEQERREALCEAMVAFAERAEQDKDLFTSQGDHADLVYELKRLVGLLRARKSNPVPPAPDRRIKSLVDGLEAVAREVGGLCAPADTFAALVAKHCTEDDERDYWRDNAGPLWGYARTYSIVPDLLRSRGVLLWTTPDVETERRIFLVDTRRPTLSALNAHLVYRRQNTRRCRLCDTLVLHHRPETYLNYTSSDGQRARIHRQCEDAWTRVVEIASKYATPEAAAAADEAAGVVPAGLLPHLDESAAREAAGGEPTSPPENGGGEGVNSAETQDAVTPCKYPGVDADWTDEPGIAPAPSSVEYPGKDGGWTGEPSGDSGGSPLINARQRRRRA